MEHTAVDVDWGLNDLHAKLLELLKYVHSFCEENNIEYVLAYGTALGAVRHQGFIPWDDDADICMTIDNYEKFRSLFEVYGDKNRFYLQECRTYDGMVGVPKLRMNGTYFMDPFYKDKDMHQGIYVDIFILHNAPASNLGQQLQLRANQYIALKSLSNKKDHRKKKFIPIFTLLSLFPTYFLIPTCRKILYSSKDKVSSLLFDTGFYVKEKCFVSKEIIFPAKLAKFEDCLLYIPKDSDKYLSIGYGDYMKIPSLESIEYSHHASEWDVNKGYEYYCPNCTPELRDEK